MAPPPLSLKRKLRLESLDERAVPDGSPGDPPDTPPPQTGSPAAQPAEQLWVYTIAADGTVNLDQVLVTAQDGGQTGPTPASVYDPATGTITTADASYVGKTGAVAAPTAVQANTVYLYYSSDGVWRSAPTPDTSVLNPVAGYALTPLMPSTGEGLAWALTPQALAVNANVAPPLPTRPGDPPPAPGPGPARPNDPVPPMPPSPAPGARPIWYWPGSVIQLGDGSWITLPQGGWVFVNPNDGGFWVYPHGTGFRSNGIEWPPGTYYEVPPQPRNHGGGVVVPPGMPPIELPRPPTQPGDLTAPPPKRPNRNLPPLPPRPPVPPANPPSTLQQIVEDIADIILFFQRNPPTNIPPKDIPPS